MCAYTVLHLNYHISLFVGRGACPSRCTEPIYPHDHCKRTITPCSHHPSSKPHYPSKSTTTLASPRKRGGGTADKNLWLAVQYSDSPAFTILSRDGGDCSPSAPSLRFSALSHENRQHPFLKMNALFVLLPCNCSRKAHTFLQG